MAAGGLKDQSQQQALKKFNATVMYNSLNEPFMDLHDVCVK